MSDVEVGAARLEKAADAYSAVVRVYEEAESDYEMAMAAERVRIYEQAKKDGERVPAEDLRESLALHAIPENIRLDYSTARANKESAAVRFRALAAAVSARQSLLKALSGS
jgi:hypothetical protein